jgi:hypothetical protein
MYPMALAFARKKIDSTYPDILQIILRDDFTHTSAKRLLYRSLIAEDDVPRFNIYYLYRNSLDDLETNRAVNITFGQRACTTIFWGCPFRCLTLYLALQTSSNQVFASPPPITPTKREDDTISRAKDYGLNCSKKRQGHL